MSQPSSQTSIPLARAALFDLLLADAPDATAVQFNHLPKPILITFGLPSHEEMEVVSLLGVRPTDEDAGALGARRREEEYDLDLLVKVQHPAAEDGPAGRKAVDDRGFALIQWVRSVVHGHWTLNGTVRTAFVVGQITDGVRPAEKGPGLLFLALVAVHCEAAVLDVGAAP
jgi:hypothetical protein